MLRVRRNVHCAPFRRSASSTRTSRRIAPDRGWILREDPAPHRRVRRRDAREIVQARAGELGGRGALCGSLDPAMYVYAIRCGRWLVSATISSCIGGSFRRLRRRWLSTSRERDRAPRGSVSGCGVRMTGDRETACHRLRQVRAVPNRPSGGSVRTRRHRTAAAQRFEHAALDAADVEHGRRIRRPPAAAIRRTSGAIRRRGTATNTASAAATAGRQVGATASMCPSSALLLRRRVRVMSLRYARKPRVTHRQRKRPADDPVPMTSRRCHQTTCASASRKRAFSSWSPTVTRRWFGMP